MAIPQGKYKGDIYLEAARGKSGFSYQHTFACTFNATTTAEPIWCQGGTYTYLSAADHLILASDDTNDDSASTGARTIQIYGLDTNYALQNEIVTLDGFNAVTTTNQYLRIFNAIVRSAGTSGYNEGKIYAIPDAAGNTFTAAGVPTITSNILMSVPSTGCKALAGIYTVPESYTAYLVHAYGTVAENQLPVFSIWTRPYGEVFSNSGAFRAYRNTWTWDAKIPIPIDAKTDIELRAYASATGAEVSGGFTLLLINE